VPHQPFKDQLAGHRRASLFVFYVAAILSTVATGLLRRLRDCEVCFLVWPLLARLAPFGVYCVSCVLR